MAGYVKIKRGRLFNHCSIENCGSSIPMDSSTGLCRECEIKEIEYWKGIKGISKRKREKKKHPTGKRRAPGEGKFGTPTNNSNRKKRTIGR